jgi:hypothetical protein
MIGEVIEAGNLAAGLPGERVVDTLMAVRHGIIAEHLASVTSSSLAQTVSVA